MAHVGQDQVSPASQLSWSRAPGPIRALARWITIVQLVGYTTSLIFIRHTTGLTATGVADRYRGSEPQAADDAMQFPKSFAEMMTITHTHLFSMAAIFVFSGLALALCTRPSERWRRILIIEPFVALLVSFSAMWLMRYVDAGFSWLLGLSSGIMAATFYIQSFFILRELKTRSPAVP
jgi:hypothetical protein